MRDPPEEKMGTEINKMTSNVTVQVKMQRMLFVKSVWNSVFSNLTGIL